MCSNNISDLYTNTREVLWDFKVQWLVIVWETESRFILLSLNIFLFVCDLFLLHAVKYFQIIMLKMWWFPVSCTVKGIVLDYSFWLNFRKFYWFEKIWRWKFMFSSCLKWHDGNNISWVWTNVSGFEKKSKLAYG